MRGIIPYGRQDISEADIQAVVDDYIQISLHKDQSSQLLYCIEFFI